MHVFSFSSNTLPFQIGTKQTHLKNQRIFDLCRIVPTFTMNDVIFRSDHKFFCGILVVYVNCRLDLMIYNEKVFMQKKQKNNNKTTKTKPYKQNVKCNVINNLTLIPPKKIGLKNMNLSVVWILILNLDLPEKFKLNLQSKIILNWPLKHPHPFRIPH